MDFFIKCYSFSQSSTVQSGTDILQFASQVLFVANEGCKMATHECQEKIANRVKGQIPCRQYAIESDVPRKKFLEGEEVNLDDVLCFYSRKLF